MKWEDEGREGGREGEGEEGRRGEGMQCYVHGGIIFVGCISLGPFACEDDNVFCVTYVCLSNLLVTANFDY